MKSYIFSITLFLLIIPIFIMGQNKLSKNEKISCLSLIWKEMHYNYPYLNRGESPNLDSLYFSYLTKIDLTNDDDEYFKLLTMFLASFKEGHTRIVSSFENKKRGTSPLTLRWLEGKVIVVAVDSLLSMQIPLGSEIIEIDKVPVKEYMDSMIIPFLSVIYENTYFYAAINIFDNELYRNYNIKIKKPDNTLKYVKFKIDLEVKSWVSNTTFESWENYKLKFIDSNICYVKLGSFMNPKVVESLLNDADSINKSKAIILDLRNNLGGTSPGKEVLGLFTSDSILEDIHLYSKTNDSYYKALGAYSDTNVAKVLGIRCRNLSLKDYFDENHYELHFNTYRNLTQIHFKQPIIVLVNEFTASAAESFLINLIDLNRIFIIGGYSFGSCTQPLIFKLPNGYSAFIASEKTVFKNGDEFRLIIPNKVVTPTINSYLKNDDLILNEAIKYLNSVK